MATRQQRSVRVAAGLLTELETLARDRLVPITFAGQVEAGLRLLAEQARAEQMRRSARLVAAERSATEIDDQLGGDRR